MLLTITHLKPPWPAGAVVGDVIDLPSIPTWALGKCAAAPQGAVVTIATQAADQPQPDADTDKPRRGRPRKDQS